MTFNRKKWVIRLMLAGALAALAALYVFLFKPASGRGFPRDLSDTLFLWGLTLLCIGLIYTTRFFGYMGYFQKWFAFRPFQKNALDDEDSDFGRPADTAEPEKRDASIVYASLLLVVFSIALSYV